MSYPITLKTLAALCAGVLWLASGSITAQSEQDTRLVSAQEDSSPQTNNCFEDFFLGSGPNYFRVCVSPHGNLPFVWSPAGYQHISPPGDEGYVVCGTGVATAYDAGPAESGWQASGITQPGGAHTYPLIITRQSVDGKLELKQTIDINLAEKEILITMALKNISGAQITDVKLARYFNGDISRYNLGGTQNFPDIYDRDADSVWGKDDGAGPGHHSLTLAALTLGQSHTAAVETFADYNNTRSTCTPVAVATVPTSPGDYTGRLTYNLGTLNAGATKTVKFIYRRS